MALILISPSNPPSISPLSSSLNSYVGSGLRPSSVFGVSSSSIDPIQSICSIFGTNDDEDDVVALLGNSPRGQSNDGNGARSLARGGM